MLGLLVSEYRDFIKTAGARYVTSSTLGDDASRNPDTVDPTLKKTVSVPDCHLDSDAEPEDDGPRPHDREGIVRV